MNVDHTSKKRVSSSDQDSGRMPGTMPLPTRHMICAEVASTMIAIITTTSAPQTRSMPKLIFLSVFMGVLLL